jgi:hypothetical protein
MPGWLRGGGPFLAGPFPTERGDECGAFGGIAFSGVLALIFREQDGD